MRESCVTGPTADISTPKKPIRDRPCPKSKKKQRQAEELTCEPEMSTIQQFEPPVSAKKRSTPKAAKSRSASRGLEITMTQSDARKISLAKRAHEVVKDY